MTKRIWGSLALAFGLALILSSGAVWAQSLTLSPSTDTNPAGTQHTVTATVTEGQDEISGTTVQFNVTSGPNAGKSGSGTTNSSGQVTFTYQSNGNTGTDTIQATANQVPGSPSDTATKTWIQAVPSTTEWGLFSLLILLMGGMAILIYRRASTRRPV